MPSTRSSARISLQQGSSPSTSPKGTKRKADSTSPKSSRGKKATLEKKQKTLEETMPTDEDDAPKDVEMKEAAAEGEGTSNGEEQGAKEDVQNGGKAVGDGAKEDHAQKNGELQNGEKDEVKEDRKEETEATNGNGAVEESSQREKAMPSSILEKGIIYFFTRSRVGIDDPEGVEDLQRSYFVLRPIPNGAKLGDGAVEDTENNRLFALPKKVLPKSHKDRFMAFVEKANTGIQTLKENVFAGSSHETKTQGTRTQSPATPIGEGVYAITETGGRNTHLAYMLTIPSELGEVQEEMGLRVKGSFVMSVKNPERKGPTYAQLPQGPEFPKEIIEEFRGLAWVPVKPEYLNYPNAQILLIGEGTEGNLAKALEPKSKDQKNDKETPKEELEKLEHEDELRVQHLHGDDTVFDDLKLSQDEYPKVPTTW